MSEGFPAGTGHQVAAAEFYQQKVKNIGKKWIIEGFAWSERDWNTWRYRFDASMKVNGVIGNGNSTQFGKADIMNCSQRFDQPDDGCKTAEYAKFLGSEGGVRHNHKHQGLERKQDTYITNRRGTYRKSTDYRSQAECSVWTLVFTNYGHTDHYRLPY